MTICIGRMGGREGDWRAELDFDNGEAIVKEQTEYGLVEVATVPLGEWVPETDEYEAALDPDCPQAQRLCKIVFAPEAWATLTSIKTDLQRFVNDPKASSIIVESVIEQIERTLECLEVPGRDCGFGGDEAEEIKAAMATDDDRCRVCGKRWPHDVCAKCAQDAIRQLNTPSGDPISGDTRPDGPFQSGSGYGGEPR